MGSWNAQFPSTRPYFLLASCLQVQKRSLLIKTLIILEHNTPVQWLQRYHCYFPKDRRLERAAGACRQTITAAKPAVSGGRAPVADLACCRLSETHIFIHFSPFSSPQLTTPPLDLSPPRPRWKLVFCCEIGQAQGLLCPEEAIVTREIYKRLAIVFSSLLSN